MQPPNMTRIVGQKKYSTRTATLVADDAFWDGHNWERQGRNTFLYKTLKGAFFQVMLTRLQGERDTLIPLTQEEAISLYETNCTEHHVSYQTAFPGVEVTEA